MFGEAALLMFGAVLKARTDGNNPFAAVVLPETSFLLLLLSGSARPPQQRCLRKANCWPCQSFSMPMPAEKSLAPTLLLRLVVAAVSFTELPVP